MTLLNKRHFEYIAATIRTLPLPARERDKAAVHFASAMRLTNPAFKTGKFLEACGALTEDDPDPDT